jgi:hypothetical protein
LDADMATFDENSYLKIKSDITIKKIEVKCELGNFRDCFKTQKKIIEDIKLNTNIPLMERE